MGTPCLTCGAKHYSKGFCRLHYYRQPHLVAAKAAYYLDHQAERIEAARRRYSENKESHRATANAWALTHASDMNQYRKKWAASNQDKVRATHRVCSLRYAKKYPEKMRALNAKRSAAKVQAVPAWADKERIAEIYRQGALLGMEVDHVVPLRSDLVCGLHVWENLQLLSQPLNREKSNKYWPDMPGDASCESQ